MSEKFKKIADNALPGEELQYVANATTDNFQKAMMHMAKWVKIISEYILNEKSFRLVVEYKPEADSTEIAFYEKTNDSDDFVDSIMDYLKSGKWKDKPPIQNPCEANCDNFPKEPRQ